MESDKIEELLEDILKVLQAWNLKYLMDVTDLRKEMEDVKALLEKE